MNETIKELNKLQKDLNLYFKKVQLETKDFRQRYKKLSKKVAKFMDKTNDPDKLFKLDKPLVKCDQELYELESYFSEWEYYH